MQFSAPFLQGLTRAYSLKDLKRAGWVKRKIPRPETVMSHAGGISLLVTLFAPQIKTAGLSVEHCYALAAIHDLPESIAGDMLPATDPIIKRSREKAAIDELAKAFSRPDFVDLWLEFEDCTSAEARFVKELDKLDPFIQSGCYFIQNRGRLKFFRNFEKNALAVITTDFLKDFMTEFSSYVVATHKTIQKAQALKVRSK
jgi:putative hydrolase of HD superfamily